jgi:hypothetical protein
MEKGQLHTKGETIHITIQEHRIHKIENKYTKQVNIGKKNNKNVSVVIRKYKRAANNNENTERTYGYTTINE